MTRKTVATTNVAASDVADFSGRELPPVHFWIHSSFRGQGNKQVKPHGLMWDMDGASFMTFVPAITIREKEEESTPPVTHLEWWRNSSSCRRGLVEAYNRWAYSKQLEFKFQEDIEDVTVHEKDGGIHVLVEWKVPTTNYEPFQYSTPDDMEAWIKQDPAAQSFQHPPVEVWVNGVYEGTLNGEMSLSPILLAIKRAQQGPGTTLFVKRYSSPRRALIRIEKYFRGMLRKQQQIFEHIVDNLIAMEDPEILDPKTLIGTATLPDWIMGGNLTSRLHIHEMENGDIQFLRPLYFDDIGTADRRFVLSQRRDPVQVAVVKKEVERLRHLATLKHPFGRNTTKKEIPVSDGVGTEQSTSRVVFDLEDTTTMSKVELQNQEDDASVSSCLAVVPGGEDD